MTRAEVKEIVKRHGFDDSDPLDTWVNAGINWVADSFRWPFLEAMPHSANVSAGSNTVVLPDDLHVIHTLKDTTSGTKLTRLERTQWERDIEDDTTTGYPEHYVMVGMQAVQIWPVPVADITIRVVYSTIVEKPEADGDELVLPENLHYPSALFAAAVGLQAENEEERAKNAQDLAEGMLGRAYDRIAGSPTRDSRGTVNDTQGYFGGY